MLQLKNNTPFAAKFALFPNEDAIDTLYLIVKASFNISSKWTLADNQVPPFEEDVYWAEPEDSSIKLASDFHIGKPTTDIIMNGRACAPTGKKVRQLDASVQVGNIKKTVRVFGDREWQNGTISSPELFDRMPIIYEKAYGGTYIDDGKVISANMSNPVGTGFAGKRNTTDMNGVALPNIEDPTNLINSIKDNPEPAGFSYLSPAWQPRANHVGTYDDEWKNTRAPYLPLDFDKRFLNMAHPDLIYSNYLQGGEAVKIENMHPQGDLHFNLPTVNLSSKVDIANRIENPEFNLESLILEPNQLRLGIVWKAAMPCDKESLKIKQMTVSLSR